MGYCKSYLYLFYSVICSIWFVGHSLMVVEVNEIENDFFDEKKIDNRYNDDISKFVDCPCNDTLLCLSLEHAKVKNASAPHVLRYEEKKTKSEIFAFILKGDWSVWSKFNWTKLTTIGIAGFYDSSLVCHAHHHGVKVVKLGNIPTNQLGDGVARSVWVKEQASDVILKFLDGINIDFENAVADNSSEQLGLSLLIKETAEVFHKAMPGSQVSVDVAWKTGGVDGRYYDYKAIGNYSDIIFVMAYDEQSQIWDGPCTARPNSGIYHAAQGIQSYLNIGIPREKMILGVPWYGYNYPCISIDSNGTCYIKPVPFRGCNCSDAAGKEYPFSFMKDTQKLYHARYHWDKDSLTPWYNIKDDKGQLRQMRYDDERSLSYKYMYAVSSGLRGVGMWTANFLDYSDTPSAVAQQKTMWDLLPSVERNV